MIREECFGVFHYREITKNLYRWPTMGTGPRWIQFTQMIEYLCWKRTGADKGRRREMGKQRRKESKQFSSGLSWVERQQWLSGGTPSLRACAADELAGGRSQGNPWDAEWFHRYLWMTMEREIQCMRGIENKKRQHQEDDVVVGRKREMNDYIICAHMKHKPSAPNNKSPLEKWGTAAK